MTLPRKVTLKSYRYRESYCKRYRYRYRESYCKRYRYRYHKKLPYMTVNLEVAIEGIIASGKTDRKVFLGKQLYRQKRTLIQFRKYFIKERLHCI